MPALGGQAVNSIIGTFCGLFSNGTHGYQFTHGIADDILETLGKNSEQLYYRNGPLTTVVYYDEVALGRWIERTVRDLGITVIVGAVMRDVDVEGRRIKKLHLATRYGDVEVEATGFVDASGDAALVYQAGFACREPTSPIYGTQMVILEHIDEAKLPTREEIPARMKEKGDKYGLVRREGLGFVIPGRGVAAMNMTHVETPLDPIEASIKGIDGKDQADRAVEFLRDEFPECFGNARIRAYGFPGIRQTRWIVGRQQLTVDDVRAGTKFPDAVARTAWPIELHDHSSGHHWHTFDTDHVHYVPLVQHDPGRRRQRRRRRPLHRRGPARTVERAGDGTVHGHGRGRRQGARSRRHRQRAPDRHRRACQARARQCRDEAHAVAEQGSLRDVEASGHMKLTDYEKEMFDGVHGRAKARAMDLLVRYGEALGAERLVETNNVAGAFNASTPSVRELVKKGFDAVYSELNLDSAEVVEVPKMVAHTCQLITGIDNEQLARAGHSGRSRRAAEAGRGVSSAAAASTCSRPARPIRSAMCR